MKRNTATAAATSAPTIPSTTTTFTSLENLHGTKVIHTCSSAAGGPASVIPVIENTSAALFTPSPTADCTMMTTRPWNLYKLSFVDDSSCQPDRPICVSLDKWSNRDRKWRCVTNHAIRHAHRLLGSTLYKLGTWYRSAGATGKMCTNSTSNWAPIPTEGLSTLGRTPAGPSVVINAFTGRRTRPVYDLNNHLGGGLLLCLHEHVVSLISLIQ